MGITGSAVPSPTDAALTTLRRILIEYTPSVVHHGDCIGADADADAIATSLGIRREAHPGHDRAGQSLKRAYCEADVIHDSLPYLMRNQIISRCPYVIALPSGPERQRSGTWTTVRYTRSAGNTVITIWPDGSVT